MNSEINKRKNIYFELIAILLTVIGKFVFIDWLEERLLFTSAISLFWIGYLILLNKNHKIRLKEMGFNKETFFPVLKLVLPFALIAVLISVITGYFLRTLNLTWHILPVLLTYPIWGVIQQFLIMGLVTGNLSKVEWLKNQSVIITLISAILFSSIHYPNNWLMLGTFFLALFYSYIYLKKKNIWVLGILHGWIGAIYFYAIVGRDPFIEVFGKYL